MQKLTTVISVYVSIYVITFEKNQCVPLQNNILSVNLHTDKLLSAYICVTYAIKKSMHNLN